MVFPKKTKILCFFISIFIVLNPIAVSFAGERDKTTEKASSETTISERQGLANRFRLEFSNMSKEKKALALNLAFSAGILTYGAVFWNYSISNRPHAHPEGWLESDSRHGGVDKLGHLYTGYIMSDMFSYTYDKWGFSRRRSSILAFLSSVTFTTVMEIGDAFSAYGLSYEDIVSNIIGASASYFLHEYPELSEKIDLRVEYRPSNKLDISTDYAHMKFLLALKAEGFEAVTNPLLKYLEFHIGYFAEGFEEDKAYRKRTIYMGLGVNLSRVFRKKSRVLSTIFTYYQMPYTYLPLEKSFKSQH